MLIAPTPPPLPTLATLCGTAALCQRGRGLGFDPTLLIGTVLKPISDFFVAKEQSKVAKKQIALQAKVLKDEKDRDARDFAYAQAQQQVDALVKPDDERRKEQLIVLTAVGGAALVISALFIVGAMKRE